MQEDDESSDEHPPSIAETEAPTVAPTESAVAAPKPKPKRKRREKTAQEKANHARFMKFSRSIKHAPDEIQKAHRASRYCSEKLQILVDEWASCQGRWKDSQLLERMRSRKSTSVHGARVWMTRAQVALKYGSQEVADEICNGKLNDPETKESHTKPHPDAPNSEVLRLYLVWDSEGISESEDRVVEQLFEACDADSDSESSSSGDKKKSKRNKKTTGKKGKVSTKDSRKKKKKKCSSSDSESVKTASSESSSSSEEKRKGKKGKKAKKSKKDKKGDKKETEKQREARLEKERKKAEKEQERNARKEKNQLLSKCKKALTSINGKVSDASKKAEVVAQLSSNLRSAIEGELAMLQRKLIKQRDALQGLVDANSVDGLNNAVDKAIQLEREYRDFLTRANLK